MTSKQIKWTTGNGSNAVVTVAVVPEITRLGDERTDGAVRIATTATVNGVDMGCTIERTNAQGCVAKMGKLGIKAEQYAAIMQAVAECKADADYVAYETRMAAAVAARDAYHSDHNKLVKAMEA